MAMTAALSTADRWNEYGTWLPSVAEQISAIDGGAFGMRGIMAQNLENSKSLVRRCSAIGTGLNETGSR
jgi:hypothetical protein